MLDESLLAQIGVRPDDLLGSGGEAVVYAVGTDQVVRVPRAAGHVEYARHRLALLDEMRAGADRIDFTVPTVLADRVIDGRLVTWEERIDGIDGIAGLGTLGDDHAARARAIRSMLDATAQIERLPVVRPWCGHLIHPEPIRAASTRAFLHRVLETNLRLVGAELAHVSADEVLDAVPLDGSPRLVHFDAFPGNVMLDGDRCTAVFDFGPLCGIADPRLDVLLFTAYLDVEITPTATDDDRAVAREWLDDHGLDDHYEAGRRFGAAFWAGTDDDRLVTWVRRVLG